MNGDREEGIMASSEEIAASEEALVEQAPARPGGDTVLMAFDPRELGRAQHHLIAWCHERIRICDAAVEEAAVEEEKSRANRWGRPAWRRALALRRNTREYYRKILLALEQGYLVIPDFPVRLFAIRTDAWRPDQKRGDFWGLRAQTAKALPQGAGRYVSPVPTQDARQYEKQDARGQRTTHTERWADEFREVVFPVQLVKPEIITRTEEAFHLKVFDEIGLVGSPLDDGTVSISPIKGDPIVVGRILKPGQPKASHRGVTFFVAWWLNPETL